MILSGLGSIEDKVKGLGVGADDYITKPFHKDELIARMRAIIRRSQGHAQPTITAGDLVVNLDEKSAYISNSRIHLTAKEFQILEFLALRKGSTLTKEMILNQLYNGMDEPELKIIDVFVCKLRKKLASASGGRTLSRLYGVVVICFEKRARPQSLWLAKNNRALCHWFGSLS